MRKRVLKPNMDDYYNEIYRLYQMGLSMNQIAKTLKKHHTTILRHLRKMKLVTSTEGRFCKKIFCKECDVEFISRSNNRKFCTTQCSARYYHKMNYIPKKRKFIKKQEKPIVLLPSYEDPFDGKINQGKSYIEYLYEQEQRKKKSFKGVLV